MALGKGSAGRQTHDRDGRAPHSAQGWENSQIFSPLPAFLEKFCGSQAWMGRPVRAWNLFPLSWGVATGWHGSPRWGWRIRRKLGKTRINPQMFGKNIFFEVDMTMRF